MNFSKVTLYFLMIIPTIFVEAGLQPGGENVCLKTITYTEKVNKIIPPPNLKPCENGCNCIKCSKNKCPAVAANVAAAAAAASEVITRSKVVASCCEGYEEDPGGVRCLPVCSNGCGNGRCVAPQKCSCHSGFSGPTCNQNCNEGKWGSNCLLDCKCSANEMCDRFVGCVCKPGWTGYKCAIPCPGGYYGFKCVNKCNCGSDSCDPITGVCIARTKPPPTKKNEEKKIKEEPKSNSSDADKNRENLKSTLDEKHDAAKVDKNVTKTVSTFSEVENSEKQTLISGGENQVQPKSHDSLISEVEDLNDFIENITAEDISAVENELLLSNSGNTELEKDTSKSSQGRNLIPTISVLSTASLLILLVGVKWFIVNIKKKIKLANDESAFDMEFGMARRGHIIFGNDKLSPEYAFDHKIKREHGLQTFNTPTVKFEKTYTKKKEPLISF